MTMPDPSLTGVTFKYDRCLEAYDIVIELLASIIREISRDRTHEHMRFNPLLFSVVYELYFKE